MGIAQSFEQRLEQYVEGFFARTFRSGLQPVELGRKLHREMDRGRTLTEHGVIVANRFKIMLSPQDDERFAHFRDSLTAELVQGLTQECIREGWRTLGPIEIEWSVDPDLRLGRYVIESRITEAAAGSAVAVQVPASTPAIPAPTPAPAPAPAAQPAAPAPVQVAVTPVQPVAALPPATPPIPAPGAASPLAETAPHLPETPPAPPTPPVAAPVPARLQLPDGHLLPIPDRGLKMGRLEDCLVRLDADPNASRHHAEIRPDAAGWRVIDLGSTNGTFVNDTRVAGSRPLQPGDRITVGRTELIFLV